MSSGLLLEDSEVLPITVIIPTFNRRDLVVRAIRSVLAQTQPAREIIVVDDGSTDGTSSHLQAHFGSKIRLLRTEQRGVSHARNTAIAQGLGPWFAFLDSDDVWLPQKLELQWQLILAKGERTLVHCDEIWMRNGRRVNEGKRHKKSGGDIFERSTELCLISPSAAVIHKDLFDRVGVFDESYVVCEDYDLWLRICSQVPVLYVEEKLVVKYGGHEDQLSRSLWGMDRFRVKSLYRLLCSQSLQSQHRYHAASMLLKKAKILEQGSQKRGMTEAASDYQSMQLFSKKVLSEYELS